MHTRVCCITVLFPTHSIVLQCCKSTVPAQRNRTRVAQCAEIALCVMLACRQLSCISELVQSSVAAQVAEIVVYTIYMYIYIAFALASAHAVLPIIPSSSPLQLHSTIVRRGRQPVLSSAPSPRATSMRAEVPEFGSAVECTTRRTQVQCFGWRCRCILRRCTRHLVYLLPLYATVS